LPADPAGPTWNPKAAEEVLATWEAALWEDRGESTVLAGRARAPGGDTESMAAGL